MRRLYTRLSPASGDMLQHLRNELQTSCIGFTQRMVLTLVFLCVCSHRKCALIAAHYSMCEVFDNLVISLCKFTTLLNPLEVMYFEYQSRCV